MKRRYPFWKPRRLPRLARAVTGRAKFLLSRSCVFTSRAEADGSAGASPSLCAEYLKGPVDEIGRASCRERV